ncbi:MAG: hypothetical protein IPM29_03195 [Planctomycetes bacterium]|nr:hypothetical protein [Planctomycetota bacterium]
MAAAQPQLATSVTRILGAAGGHAWFDQGGTVWATDGTVAGTRNSRVYSGFPFTVRGQSILLYGPQHAYRIDGGAAVEAIPLPIAWDGFDSASADPRVWRRIPNPVTEILEIWTYRNGSWSGDYSAVWDPTGFGFVERVHVRPDRYLVQYTDSNLTTATHDLLGRIWHGGTSTGTCSWSWNWSNGVITCAEDGANAADAVTFFEDGGPAVEVPLPSSWGWGVYDFTVREVNPGFPFLESNRRHEFIAPQVDTRVRPMPPALYSGGQTPGFLKGMFWAGSPAVFFAAYARSDRGADDYVYLDRSTNSWVIFEQDFSWNSIVEFGLLGERSGEIFIGQVGGVRIAGRRFEAANPANNSVFCDGGPLGFARIGNGFLFHNQGLTTAHPGDGEPWFYEAGSSHLFAAIAPGSTNRSRPREFTELGSHVVFLADDGTGTALYGVDTVSVQWRQSPVNRHWYTLATAGSWNDVRRRALETGGDLVTIRDAAEQAWIIGEFPNEQLWIGLEDFDRDGVFRWTSGDPASYRNWCPGEPNRSVPDEDVVHIGNCASGGWNDISPTLPFFGTARGIVERASLPSPVEQYGSGCSPSGFACQSYGPSTLEHRRGYPGLGQTIEFDYLARELPTGANPTATVMFASRNGSFAGLQLPFSLGSFGWDPSCSLYVEPTLFDPVVLDAFGRGSWSNTVANVPALVGSTWFAQGLTISTTGVLTCFESTNAIRFTVGL